MVRLELPERDVVGIRAENSGPFTLSGTNSWFVGRDPAWLIDPGPALDSHRDALLAEAAARGGLAAIVLTHDHPDHAEGVPALRERLQVPVLAARGDVERVVGDGERLGPLLALATPGHAMDHLAYLAGDVLFSGDAILGEGSVFIAPDPGALAGYLHALKRLRDLAPGILCPAHGPIVEDVQERIDGYIAHRLDRERRLLAALAAGRRSVEELLEAAWPDAPSELRAAAAVTLAAHLDKLSDEGRLPSGVERPRWR